ncbi:MAG TPA: hypothetical protein VGI39_23280, partial [Polyangiaceae bacterium]
MNYNPYAAPQAPPPPVAGPMQGGAQQPWEIGEVLGSAWEIFKRNWAVLVFTSLLGSLIGMGPYFVISAPALMGAKLNPNDPTAFLS